MVRWSGILGIPLARRLQTLAVFVFCLLQPLAWVINFFIFFSPLMPLMVLYIGWFLLLDKAPYSGGRRSRWVRECRWMKYFRDYFPISLKRTAELDPKKNYVFGYHPHGIISLGAFVNVASEATKISELFPGLEIRLLTLTTNFKIPLLRELFLWLGLCDVSRRSCNNILRKGPGHSLMIVIGGAAESLLSRPGSAELTLARRKGFVKVALQNGASLVPVYGFGETDVYDQYENPQGSKVRHYQTWMQKTLGFTLPLFHGRGVWNYDFGLMPYRRPITTVVGKPIDCPKVEDPSTEVIDKYHKLYVDGLKDLFETHKAHYVPNSKNLRLQIVE